MKKMLLFYLFINSFYSTSVLAEELPSFDVGSSILHIPVIEFLDAQLTLDLQLDEAGNFIIVGFNFMDSIIEPTAKGLAPFIGESVLVGATSEDVELTTLYDFLGWASVFPGSIEGDFIVNGLNFFTENDSTITEKFQLIFASEEQEFRYFLRDFSVRTVNGVLVSLFYTFDFDDQGEIEGCAFLVPVATGELGDECFVIYIRTISIYSIPEDVPAAVEKILASTEKNKARIQAKKYLSRF